MELRALQRCARSFFLLRGRSFWQVCLSSHCSVFRAYLPWTLVQWINFPQYVYYVKITRLCLTCCFLPDQKHHRVLQTLFQDLGSKVAHGYLLHVDPGRSEVSEEGASCWILGCRQLIGVRLLCAETELGRWGGVCITCNGRKPEPLRHRSTPQWNSFPLVASPKKGLKITVLISFPFWLGKCGR